MISSLYIYGLLCLKVFLCWKLKSGIKKSSFLYPIIEKYSVQKAIYVLFILVLLSFFAFFLIIRLLLGWEFQGIYTTYILYFFWGLIADFYLLFLRPTRNENNFSGIARIVNSARVYGLYRKIRIWSLALIWVVATCFFVLSAGGNKHATIDKLFVNDDKDFKLIPIGGRSMAIVKETIIWDNLLVTTNLLNYDSFYYAVKGKVFRKFITEGEDLELLNIEEKLSDNLGNEYICIEGPFWEARNNLLRFNKYLMKNKEDEIFYIEGYCEYTTRDLPIPKCREFPGIKIKIE